MEGNGFSGRLFSNIGGGMLGLEMALQPPPQPTITQNQQHIQHHHHPQMVAFSLPPPPHHHHQQQQQFDHRTQLSMRQPSSNTNPSPKTQMTQLANSDEDERGFQNEDNSSFDGKRKSTSPWQRMKWTDNMVRLLIMAVYYIGDEGGSENKKPGGYGGHGQLQKKGKWKSVSKAMMEKGFCVSPQQCEDKFNDLNKRYKRVNEILGKGTACKVVENQNLLDTMDHLSPKIKEEVRKLLNSKHLFFREMCAYHNSCGHGSSANQPIEASPQNPPAAREEIASQQPHHQQQQNLCLQSSMQAPSPPSSSMVHSNSRLDDHDFEDDSDSDSESNSNSNSDSDSDSDIEGRERKRARTTRGISSNTLWALPEQQLRGDLMGVLQDSNRSSWEKKQWVMTQMAELEEQGVKFQYQALEIEKQRMKWFKYSSKKEREIERNKLENEKKRLQNERMLLFLRQKEIELLMLHQRPSNLSSVGG